MQAQKNCDLACISNPSVTPSACQLPFSKGALCGNSTFSTSCPTECPLCGISFMCPHGLSIFYGHLYYTTHILCRQCVFNYIDRICYNIPVGASVRREVEYMEIILSFVVDYIIAHTSFNLNSARTQSDDNAILQ